MRPFRSVGLFPSTTAWTCRSCLQKQRNTASDAVRSASNTAKGNVKRRRKAPVVLTAATGTLGAGTLFFTDDVKHGYAAVERTGRVVSTLAVCINE